MQVSNFPQKSPKIGLKKRLVTLKLRFQLYFPTLAITQHRQQEDYSSNQFVSELGGAAGLVLGVSLVSIIRMIDCFISRTLDIHRDTAGACFNISIPAHEKETDKVYRAPVQFHLGSIPQFFEIEPKLFFHLENNFCGL